MSFLEHQCDRCGKTHSVERAQAGATLDCACGQRMTLPPLSQLRKQTGMAAFEKSTAATIIELVAEGRLPKCSNCVRCSVSCDELPLVAICEQGSYSARAVGGGGGAFIGGIFGGIPFLIPLGGGSPSRITERQSGRDLVVPVPMCICDHCWNTVSRHRSNTLLRRGALALRFAAIASLLLWFTRRVAGFGIPFSWALLCIGCAVISSVMHRWYASRTKNSVKSVLQETLLYRELCEEYPDAEIVKGRLEDYTVRNGY